MMPSRRQENFTKIHTDKNDKYLSCFEMLKKNILEIQNHVLLLQHPLNKMIMDYEFSITFHC